jgi:hypothetical protein
MNSRLKFLQLTWNFLFLLLFSIGGSQSLLAQASEPDKVEEGTSSGRKPGITVIVEATGSVELIEAPGQAPQPVQKGQRVPVGGILVTGPDGRVDLALSNGAFMQIQENSRFGIGEFEQEAYEFVFSNGEAIRPKELKDFGADEAVLTTMDASEEAWNKLAQEPTTSATKFNLEYGTMIGESKKLRPGSRMEIVTPIGVAGIRGTTWRLTITPVGGPGSNVFRGTLDVGRGQVTFSNADGTRAVDVTGGFSMRVEAVIEGPQQVRFNILETGQMSPERAAALDVVTQAVQSVQTYFQAVQGTPADLGITLGNNADANQGTGDTQQPQVDLPPATNIQPGGGTGNLPNPPQPTPTPTPPPTPTPTPTPSPTVSPLG